MHRLHRGTAALVLAVLVAGLGVRDARAQDRLSIATGGTGGVYYPYGGAMANVLSDHLEDVEVTAEVTSASVDNMILIGNGDVDLAFTLADTAFDAVQGNEPFEEPIPALALATLYDNFTHIVTTEDSGINTVADLRDKRVSTGAAGSGTEVIANRILEAAGLNPDEDIEREQLGATESADAIRDRQIDAYFWSGGLPTGSVTDLGATPNIDLKLIGHGQLAQALQEEYGPFYATDVIPADTYPNQTEDVEVIIVPNVLVVHEDFDEQLAYDILRVLFEQKAELVIAHPVAEELTLENAVQNSPIPYHPGALRFYEENGVSPPGTPPAAAAA